MSASPGGPPTPAEILDHLDDLARWCRRQCGDSHLAEDVAQEAALAALVGIHTVRDRRHLRGWLFRVAQRRFADAYRGWRGDLPLTREPPAPDPDDRRSPELERRIRRRVRRLLRRLPLRLRRPMRMHYLEGHPLRVVASRLGTTVNAIKSRLYRARQLLRVEDPA
ncbi:MAG: RNA polymerase sigma factor [Planctomycetota bacterium]